MNLSNNQPRKPVASTAHLCLILILLACFTIVLRLTGALTIVSTSTEMPGHTGEIARFCLVVSLYLWVLCLIVWIGTRATGSGLTKIIGTSQARKAGALRTALASLTAFTALLLVGSATNALLVRFGVGTQALRGFTVRNIVEAWAFLAAAFTAGFAEELVFRGYLQQQFYSRTGSVLIATVLQVAIFTLGHMYQGWLRLIAVALEGLVLTLTALWRKSLVPGMVAHGVGDGLLSLVFLTRLLLK